MGGGPSFPAPDKALQAACKSGDLNEVKAAIADGADVNSMSPQPAIIVAAWWGHSEVIKWMFEECKEDHVCETLDKDIRSTMVKGGSAMHACCGRNHGEVFKVMTAKGGDARVLIHAKDDNLDDAYMVIGKYADRKMSAGTALMKAEFMKVRGEASGMRQ